MSRAIKCDQCGETLTLNKRGDDEMGEISGWVNIKIADMDVDVCTRSCAIAFLNDEDVVSVHEAQMEAIADIARAIREGRGNDAA